VNVLAAKSTAGWHGSVAERRAVWTGGHVPPLGIARVVVHLTPTGEPGPVRFRVRQRFADDRSVNWPLELTVTPGRVGDDGGATRDLTLAVVGFAAAATVLFVLWLRRRRLAVS
jgi:hypothetical protein